MIISFKKKFVFIHNPKVGGTSVRTALEKHHDYETKFWHQAWHPGVNRVVDMAHLTADQWKIQTAEDGQSLFTFGLVRNPYDRFWSAVKEFDRRHGADLKLNTNNIHVILTPANIRHDWRFIHFCPQRDFFYLGDKCVADYIGRYETLAQSWGYITSRLGPEFQAELPHERQSMSDHPLVQQLQQDPDVWLLIGRLYALDFVTFNYPNTYGSLFRDSHGDRVDVIHNPMFHEIRQHIADGKEDHFNFSVGEQKEFRRKTGVYPPIKSAVGSVGETRPVL